MTDDVYGGIILSGDSDTPCSLAFLSDTVDTYTVKDDERIVELIKEHSPRFLAFSNPLHGPDVDDGFRDDEEELVDDGYSFRPPAMHDNDKLERTVFLKNTLKKTVMPEMIECRPRITAEVLDIEEDEDLADFGLIVDAIRSMREFEAVLAAITAQFYAQDQYEEQGFIVPKELD